MQIQKTLPPFIRDVTLEDFHAVASLSYISPNTNIYADDPWNTFLNVSPAQFMEVLTFGLPGNPTVDISSDDDGDFVINITEECNLYTDESRLLGAYYVEPGNLEVNAQGKNIGRNIIRNYIELGVLLEREGFRIDAAGENGGYTWAKMGFPLDESFCTDALQKRLKRKISQIGSRIPASVSQRVSELSDRLEPLDICAIADESLDLESIFPDDDLEAMSGSVFMSLAEEFCNQGQKVATAFSNANAEIIRIKRIKNYCLLNNKPLTLGLYLLYGERYDAHLSFSDEVSMQRVEKYVGGFNFITLGDEAKHKPVNRHRTLNA